MSEIRCTVIFKEPVSPYYDKEYSEQDKWFSWDPEQGESSLRGPEKPTSAIRSKIKLYADQEPGKHIVDRYKYQYVVQWNADPWHNIDDMRFILASLGWYSPELGGLPEGEEPEVPPEQPGAKTYY